MIGYRLDSAHSVHIYSDHLDTYARRQRHAPVAYQTVNLVQTFEGEYRLLDSMSHLPISVPICEPCTRRQKAHPAVPVADMVRATPPAP